MWRGKIHWESTKWKMSVFLYLFSINQKFNLKHWDSTAWLRTFDPAFIAADKRKALDIYWFEKLNKTDDVVFKAPLLWQLSKYTRAHSTCGTYYNNLRPQLFYISFLVICKYMIFYCKSRHVYYYFHYIFGKYSPKYHFLILRG